HIHEQGMSGLVRHGGKVSRPEELHHMAPVIRGGASCPAACKTPTMAASAPVPPSSPAGHEGASRS
ncbi:MAG: hypothetical protein IKS68_08255, partial [Mailhella sp.]|nr:hypothetical protein [Mailhella sp.]